MAPSVSNSQRFSTISGTASLALSDHTISSAMTGDSRLAEIKELGAGLERLENKPLSKQRFVPTAEKTDNLNKLALGAKVETCARQENVQPGCHHAQAHFSR
ncbi:predicted protein [Histoplasma mississippiense (nom. inval.)]|uniref:predicted protein n=1 Tax=Ajellomyces capsulatus (strain NAm1 / WU24) TaxID=2059318 RepID=UPI000157C787|nr:predicted protein [Histoplasma mississippiense (nom. inval.)]EDN08172.1 predicted protein [Histoplasma mississippiense (nom. inval.)]